MSVFYHVTYHKVVLWLSLETRAIALVECPCPLCSSGIESLVGEGATKGLHRAISLLASVFPSSWIVLGLSCALGRRVKECWLVEQNPIESKPRRAS